MALKNTSKNSVRGQTCEGLALQYYQKQNFILIRQRWKSPFAEIDLVLRSPLGELVLVEVKSVSSFEFLHLRLTPRQKRRLQRAVLFCAEREPLVRFELAVVSQEGAVLTFSDIFG